MPRQVALQLCGAAGALWYLAAPGARRSVRKNLRHVLGREPTRAMVRKVFTYGALNYWDILAIPQLSRDEILQLVELKGSEHIDAARAAGHGVILASAHLASVSLVGQVLPAVGYPLIGLLEPIDPPEVFDFLARRRQTFGGRLLPTGPAALREVVSSLRRNEVLGLITDRDLTGGAPFVDFFGAPTRFPDGAAALSVRTGAPILPAIAIMHQDGRFEAHIEAPLIVPATSDRNEAVRLLTRAVVERLEYHIASHPEQWTVFQERWPDGQPR